MARPHQHCRRATEPRSHSRSRKIPCSTPISLNCLSAPRQLTEGADPDELLQHGLGKLAATQHLQRGAQRCHQTHPAHLAWDGAIPLGSGQSNLQLAVSSLWPAQVKPDSLPTRPLPHLAAEPRGVQPLRKRARVRPGGGGEALWVDVGLAISGRVALLGHSKVDQHLAEFFRGGRQEGKYGSICSPLIQLATAKETSTCGSPGELEAGEWDNCSRSASTVGPPLCTLYDYKN